MTRHPEKPKKLEGRIEAELNKAVNAPNRHEYEFHAMKAQRYQDRYFARTGRYYQISAYDSIHT